jgi:hypothetical protein
MGGAKRPEFGARRLELNPGLVIGLVINILKILGVFIYSSW